VSEIEVEEGKEITNPFISGFTSKNENILEVDEIMRMLLPCLIF